MTVRVATLLRLSTTKQARRQGHDEPDIPAQRQAIAAFLAGRPDWAHVREYQEAGVSAFKKSAAERDVLQDALRDAAAGHWSVLVVWKADRLSRNSVEYPQIVARLRQYGVALWSVADAPGGKELSLQTQTDKFIRFLEGWQAETESVNTQIRVSARMRQLAREGRWTGSKVPFGYALVAVKDAAGEPVFRAGKPVRTLVPHGTNAPVVRELFRRYLAGEGAQRLAAWLNAAGVPTYHHRQWSDTTVRELLTNPLYAGLVVYGRTSETPIITRGQHEALIDEATWEQACALRRQRNAVPHRQRGGPYALTGILRCGRCGSAMGGITRRRGAVERQGYRCLGWSSRRACPVTEYRADAVEAAFLAAVSQLELPRQLGALLVPAADPGRAVAAQLEATRQALARVDAAYFEAAILSPAEYQEKRRFYLARRAELEAALAHAGAELPADAVAGAARDLPGIWPYMTPAERKLFATSLLNAYGLRAHIQPDKTVELRGDGGNGTP
ncbi:MAG TPA: recombinase family protein [Symbiobacteriaceae bacterium]|nr:recombinase family protein [Symbiobacteriaceae bacterium]